MIMRNSIGRSCGDEIRQPVAVEVSGGQVADTKPCRNLNRIGEIAPAHIDQEVNETFSR